MLFLPTLFIWVFSRHRIFKFHSTPHTLLIRMSSLGHEPLICFIDDGNRMFAVQRVLYAGVGVQLSSLVVADNTFCDYEDTDLMLSLEIEALTERPPCLLNYIALTLHTLLLNKYGL